MLDLVILGVFLKTAFSNSFCTVSVQSRFELVGCDWVQRLCIVSIIACKNVQATFILFYFSVSAHLKSHHTTQPSYLHNLITVQPPHSTRSSSLVTLARPSTSSSLRITDRSFQYASPRLWNQRFAVLVEHRLVTDGRRDR